MVNKKAQLKIQQMAFMLMAVTFFFVLVFMVVMVYKSSGLRESAELLEEKNAILLATKLANSPEFSCGNSFGTKKINCVDADKIMMLKENPDLYLSFWGVKNIEVRKIYPSETSELKCTLENYPDCEIIRIREKSISGTGEAKNFVSLCRKAVFEEKSIPEEEIEEEPDEVEEEKIVDLIFVGDSSGSFKEEWKTLDEGYEDIKTWALDNNVNLNIQAYALDPAYTLASGHGKITMTGDYGACSKIYMDYSRTEGCGTSGTQYYSTAQYPIIDGYVNSKNCDECIKLSNNRISNAPSEAWGVGARKIVESNSYWRSDSLKIIFFFGDHLPAGGDATNYRKYNEEIAEDLKSKAKEKDITLYGFYGEWEFKEENNYGNPNENDAKELMEFVAEGTGGDVSSIGTSFINKIIDKIGIAVDIEDSEEESTPLYDIGNYDKCEIAILTIEENEIPK
jgi:hypothetical protein